MRAAAKEAVPDDADLCVQAIARAERGSRLPPKLLDAIGLVESGRFAPARHTVLPWPWTVNASGVSYYYASKPEAVTAVQGFQAAGMRSIDVGCMQVSLLYHPDAFGSLDEAFEPQANAAFAAHFLTALFRDTGDWPAAAAAYKSRTPDIAAAYWQRVAAAWPSSRLYGDGAPAVQALPRRVVDPYAVATPEFTARLEADVAFRTARDTAMLGTSCPPNRDDGRCGAADAGRAPTQSGRSSHGLLHELAVRGQLAGAATRPLAASLRRVGW